MLKCRIKEARKAKGMTQKEVADRIGVAESTFCCYESGKRQPDAVKLSAIARVLGVTGDYLLENETEEADSFSALEMNLLAMFRELRVDQKDTVMALVYHLYEQKNMGSSVNKVTVG